MHLQQYNERLELKVSAGRVGNNPRLLGDNTFDFLA